jgi:nicotinamidase-related amidase
MPIPSFYNPALIDTRRKVDMQMLEVEAEKWAKMHNIKPAASDQERICVLAIDLQVDFTNTDGNLYVGGRSGRGSVDDNDRICRMGYELLPRISKWFPTMDTHTKGQIFLTYFWVDDQGNHPAPGTIITEDDVKSGRWKPNPAICNDINAPYMWLQKYCQHYTKTLGTAGKYALMIWPYHTMLGESGHALNPSFFEMVFFHSVARKVETGFEIKGGKTLTENYSVMRPEVTESHDGIIIGELNVRFFEHVLEYDKIWVLGQAGSHCLAWTAQDILELIMGKDPALAKKVSIVTDCTSSVVIPGVVDFTDMMNDTFAKFQQAGMNLTTTKELLQQYAV